MRLRLAWFIGSFVALIPLLAWATRHCAGDTPHAARRASVVPASAAPTVDSGTRPGAPSSSWRPPVAFVENVGQWPSAARFVARSRRMVLGAEPDAMIVEFRGAARGARLRLGFEGCREDVRIEGEGLRPERYGFVLGNDSARWRTGVRAYASVRYRGVHEGVDVRVREGDGGRLEYDLLLEPEADLDDVVIHCEGAQSMRISAAGDLVLETPAGSLRQPRPVAWEVDGVDRDEVRCRFRLLDDNRFGFVVEHRSGSRRLVVDPGLVWSTYLGGTGDDGAWAVAVDAAGVATVLGITASASFPTTAGAFDPTYNGGAGWGDAVVARLSASGGSLLYATFLGGTGADRPAAIAVDPGGLATIVGVTNSTDFPTTAGAFDTTPNGGHDIFVTRLSASGAGLVYSTYLGGTRSDRGADLALGDDGSVTVVGNTDSPDYPTTVGALSTTINGGADALATKLSPQGNALVYSTFLGGSDSDTAYAVALDATGDATLGGATASTDFPSTPGAFAATNSGAGDGFVARLDAAGRTLVYSTYLGGNAADTIWALSLDAAGDATVAGWTRSSNFPATPGAYDTTPNGYEDGFVARLDATGSTLGYATYLGGAGVDLLYALALDARGGATIVGSTSSADFPTTVGSFQPVLASLAVPRRSDAWVTRLSPAGDSLVYSTFLGGTDGDGATNLALDAADAAIVVGNTQATDFPTTGAALSTANSGGADAFVAHLDLLPTGVRVFGRSSWGCAGPLAIGITAAPLIGSTFALTCGNAPPSANGVVFFGAAGLTTPITAAGVEVWVDPNSAWFVPLPVSSNSLGAAEFPASVPGAAGLVGLRFAAQFAWVGSPAPCPPRRRADQRGDQQVVPPDRMVLALSMSNAIEVTLQ